MLRSLAVVVLLATGVSAADPALYVVRVKPGETKSVELALRRPGQEFPPQGKLGRSFLDLSVLTPGDNDVKETPVKVKDNNRYDVTPDFTVVWSTDKPELEFHAGRDMKKGATDLRIVYRRMGGGEHVAEFRVIVE
jgi:hypothetical protein